MRLLEAVLLVTMTVLLARLIVIPTLIAKLPKHFAILAAMLSLALNLIAGRHRWQLIPAYVVLGFLLLVSMKKQRVHLAWRIVGTSICGALILISVFLAQQLPVLQLPKPEGPFAVGTFSYSETDESRVEVFEPLSHAKRVVSAEVWYPAAINEQTNSYPVRPLWGELYQGPWDWIAFFTAYLGEIETHSHIDAPIARSTHKFPVLLFNSGLYGWVSQNTLLMEHLASHGYVIFSISHPYEQLKVQLNDAHTLLPNFNGPPNQIQLTPEAIKDYQTTSLEMLTLPNREQRLALAKTYMNLVDKLETLATPREQLEYITADLQRVDVSPIAKQNKPEALYHFYQGWKIQNEIMSRWTSDTAFIASQLRTLKAPVADFAESLDVEQLGALGHSFGGATAAEFCKVDSRCKAGLNMDGEQFGKNWRAPLKVPFAMMYSSSWAGFNDFAYLDKRDDYLEYAVTGAHHMDFTDLPRIMPLIKHLPVDSPMLVGPIRATRMNELVNGTVLAFFDRYLKNLPTNRNSTDLFPEAELRTMKKPAPQLRATP